MYTATCEVCRVSSNTACFPLRFSRFECLAVEECLTEFSFLSPRARAVCMQQLVLWNSSTGLGLSVLAALHQRVSKIYIAATVTQI